MISLAKSKEYTKLANQVPNVFQVMDGKPVLTGPKSLKRGVVVSKHKNVFNFNTINVVQGSADSIGQNPTHSSFDGGRGELNMSSARQTQ
jgi:hypothetical protein